MASMASAIVRHPAYAPTAGKGNSQLNAFLASCRERIVSILGLLRQNKNLVEAVHGFERQAVGKWRLVIAGECVDEALHARLVAAQEGSRRVFYFPGFLSEEDFDAAITASTLVAIPYGSTHTSGVAVRALSCRQRVLAQASPEMVEIESLVPSMVRTVPASAPFWSPLASAAFEAWLDDGARTGLPGEFSPQHCQRVLRSFYARLCRQGEAQRTPGE
jgi:hypothetical protein